MPGAVANSAQQQAFGNIEAILNAHNFGDKGPEHGEALVTLQPIANDVTVDDRGHLKCHQLQRETVQNGAKWRNALKARPERGDDKKSGLEPSLSGFSGYNPRSDSEVAGVAQLVEQRFCKP